MVLPAVAIAAGAAASAAGSAASGLLAGSKQGSDDLRKLQKRALQTNPLDEIAKSQEAALREAMLLNALTDMIERKALRDDMLRLAGFSGEYARVPLFEGPSVITRKEKGPPTRITVPGGPAVLPAQNLPPEVVSQLDLLGPLLVALRNPIVQVAARSKGGGPLDRAVTQGLVSGRLRPGEVQAGMSQTGGFNTPSLTNRLISLGLLPPQEVNPIGG